MLVVIVIMPFVVWRMTWFGGRLTDEQLERYLASTDEPRNTQHALVQVTERIIRADAGVSRYYPAIIRLSDCDEPRIRNMCAWVMGFDANHQPFHAPLVKLLNDPALTVRQNAALALSKFADSSALPVLRGMLEPSIVFSPAGGKVTDRVLPRAPVKLESKIGDVITGDGKTVAILPPIEGQLLRWSVKDNESVTADQPIGSIQPGHTQLWETLRALALIGTNEDEARIQRLADNAAMSADLREQAESTLDIIKRRSQ